MGPSKLIIVTKRWAFCLNGGPSIAQLDSDVDMADNNNRNADTICKLKSLVLLVWFRIAAQPSVADDRAQVLGVGKLVSSETRSD